MTDKARRGKRPRIVAELGRPETAEEALDRKAAASRTHRANQTTMNLVIALAASLAVVLLVVMVVARTNERTLPNVDYRAIAASAQASAAEPLAIPDLPSTWVANAAEIRPLTADKVVTWYIGFITPSDQFISVSQGIHANDSWVANQVQGNRPTGATTVNGTTWTIYDHRANPGASKNLAYAMSASTASSSYVLFGTASEAEFLVLAKALELDNS